MNYREVLEKQIEQLEAVQGRLTDLIVNKKAEFTGRTLNSIVDASARIESLVNSIINLEKETAANSSSNGQNHEK